MAHRQPAARSCRDQALLLQLAHRLPQGATTDLQRVCSSVSTRCVPGANCPDVMAFRNAVSACSRRLVFSSRSSDVESTDIERSLDCHIDLSNSEPYSRASTVRDEPRRRQVVPVVQGR